MSLSVSVGGGSAFGGLNGYWGQHGSGDRLIDYCNTGIEYITLSVVNRSPEKDPSGYPGTNFASHCWGYYNNEDGVQSHLLSECMTLKEDISLCKNLGVKVLLSIGGEYNPAWGNDYEVTTPDNGADFADFLYKAFGPYHSSWTGPRPFDSLIGHNSVDGFDFDIEHEFVHGNAPYVAMVEKFRSLDPSLIITAAPQCPTDETNFYLKSLIHDAKFDALFIQFYNNPYCDAIDGSTVSTANMNYDAWEGIIASSAKSQNAKLYVGLPASPAGAPSGGYISPNHLKEIVCDLKNKPHFGGISLWDLAYGAENTVGGKTYQHHAMDALKYGCDPIPTTTSTTARSTTTTTTTTSSKPTTTTTTTSTTTSSTTTSTSTTVRSTTTSASTATSTSTTSSAQSTASSTESTTTSAQSTTTSTQSTTSSAESSTTSAESTTSTAESTTSTTESTTTTSAQSTTSSDPTTGTTTATSDVSSTSASSTSETDSTTTTAASTSTESTTSKSGSAVSTTETHFTSSSAVPSFTSHTGGWNSTFTTSATLSQTTLDTTTGTASETGSETGSITTGNGPVTTGSVSMTTSTVYTTSVHTVTKCPPEVTDCPVGGYVTTETIALYTTVCPVTEAHGESKPTITEAPSWETKTIFTTQIHTITSCPPEVHNCPVGSVVTQVAPWTTTVVRATVVKTVEVAKPTGEAPAPSSGNQGNNEGNKGGKEGPHGGDKGCTGEGCVVVPEEKSKTEATTTIYRTAVVVPQPTLQTSTKPAVFTPQNKPQPRPTGSDKEQPSGAATGTATGVAAPTAVVSSGCTGKGCSNTAVPTSPVTAGASGLTVGLAGLVAMVAFQVFAL